MTDDDHLFDDAPQGVGPSIAGQSAAAAVASQPQPQTQTAMTHGTISDDHLFDDAPQGMSEVSGFGAFARGAALSAAPSAGGMVGAGPGAELGAAVGSAAAGPIGTVVGGLAGGLGGYLLGSTAVGAAQDYLISKLPESWRDEFEEKSQAAAAEHPFGFWLGGLAPVAITGNPLSAAGELPANATAIERLMANPVTRRLLPAGLMGATEAFNENRAGEPVDPTKIALSTAAGLFFPGQNRIGQKLSELGTSPFRPRVVAPNEPTVAEAGDMKVAGPGITEQVYQGQEQMSPQAEASTISTAQAEEAATEGPRTPDVQTVARQMSPELLARYDALQEQADSSRKFIESMNAPPQEQYDALTDQFNALNDSLEAEKNQAEQRRIRAQMRDVGNQWAALDERRTAFEAGQGQDTPEMTAARQRIQEANQSLWDMHGDVQAAYLRAAESAGSETHAEPETVAPEQTPPAPEAAATAGEAQPPEAPPQPIQTREDVKNGIVQHITDQLKGTKYSDQQINDFALVNAALYDTLAARTGGSARDLYDRWGPLWNTKGVQKTVRPNVLELTQRAPPPPETEGAEFEQGAKGKVRIVEGKRPIATLFKDADFSTLIHEGVGHPLLEMMGELAEHPDAPADIRDDWQTVKDWLGVKDREDIQTRQHEKFARGFEQYVREGVAPSPGLARTFSRIKQWMTAIYQTLKGLGKPINDDIRQVFDRLLAEEPHPTVIVPEAERGPTLADIHEADAELTHPEDAEAVRDRVVSERDKAIEEVPPNVRQEIESAVSTTEAPQSAGEVGEGPGGPSGMVGSSGEPGAESGSGARREAGSTLERGGGPTQPEGPYLAAGAESERPVHVGESAGNAFAPVTAPIWQRPESGLTDRAGNIVLRNLTPENFGQALVESAERNGDFKAVRGDMTKGQMWDLATELGLNLEDVNLEDRLARIVGKFHDLAPVALALRRLTRESAKNVWQIASIAAKSQSDADAAHLAATLSRHDMIQSALSGATASWGRTGSAFHNLRSFPEGAALDQALRQTTGRTLYQLKMMAKMLAGLDGKSEADQTAALSQFVRDSGQYSFGRMILEYWVNGLISGIPTHVTYAVGNTLSAAANVLLDTPTAAAIGALRKAAGRQGEVIPFGETAARLRGAQSGLAPAVTAAIEATRTGAATTLPGQSPGMTPKIPGVSSLGAASLKEHATFVDAAPALYALGRGLKDGLITGGAIATVGGPNFQREYSLRGAIPNFRVLGAQIPVGDIARLPGRMVAANHSFFTGLGYAIEMNGLEYRQAWNEGHRGDKLADRITQLRLNRTPEMMEQASKAALEGALMGPGGQWARMASEFTNKSFTVPGLGEAPYLKFIDPFVHIGANLINKAIVERTPVGLLTKTMRDDLTGVNGTAAQDMASAKMAVGTAIAMTFGWLAAEGLMTGSGPQDPRQRAVWQMAGYLPHSVLMGGQWIQLNRLGPIGLLMGMAADLYGVARAASEDDMATVAGLFTHAIAQNIVDQSWLKGPSDVIKATEDENFARSYISNQLASFVPASVQMGYLTRAMDPHSRQARTFLDKVRAQLPFDVGFGQSTDLFPKRDLWGMPIPNLRSIDGAGLTAIWTSRLSGDPVTQEMLRLGYAPDPVSRRVRGVTLTDAQYDEYAGLAGRMTKMQLDRMVNSTYWARIPDAAKKDIIEHAFKASREAASPLVPGFKDVLRAATQSRLDRVQGKTIRAIR